MWHLQDGRILASLLSDSLSYALEVISVVLKKKMGKNEEMTPGER